MIFCFSGTGNSRYIARRFAEALKDTVVDLNAKIKAQDNSLIQTGKDVIIVVPTYAWRIPRVVSEWLTKTELASAECIWFVMDCGSEIGNAAKYNRHLAEQMKLRYMGTAQVVMPENYIAMFGVPEAEEAVKIVNRAKDVNRQVCAVGTTVMRAIESTVSTDGHLKEYEGWTNKFIFPPYDFTVANAMVSNFHMPLSTLLMIVAAFGGYEQVMEAYNVALKEEYRFGTYGDAMLITDR